MDAPIDETLETELGLLRAHLDHLEQVLRRYQQVHTALRENDGRFRLLVEQVQEYAIFMLDGAGYVVSWNVGAERIKGYPAADILGQHFSRFYLPDAIASGKPAQLLARARAAGQVEDEDWRGGKDGSSFLGNMVITALYY